MSFSTLSQVDIAALKVAGLVIFLAVFIGIVLWTLTRSRRQIDRWSEMPLDDQPDHPGDPQTEEAEKHQS